MSEASIVSLNIVVYLSTVDIECEFILREHDDENDEETINLQHLSQYLYLVQPLEERCHRIYKISDALQIVNCSFRQYRLQL